jgi:hypothetical protein
MADLPMDGCRLAEVAATQSLIPSWFYMGSANAATRKLVARIPVFMFLTSVLI